MAWAHVVRHRPLMLLRIAFICLLIWLASRGDVRIARLESLKQELSRQLAGVLAWETLVPIEVRIQSLLFGVEVDVLGKELVDFLPLSVLAESDDGPCLLALCDAPSETCQVVLLMEPAVDLSQGHHVPLIPRAEYDVIFERGYRNVPEIEFLRHELK